MEPDDLRASIPLLRTHAYLDSAATSLKPAPVLDAQRRFYDTIGASPDRAAHALGGQATDALEQARSSFAGTVLGAPAGEVVFTRNATEALNLLAHAFGAQDVQGHDFLRWRPRDVVLTTIYEHHSNLMPWQRLAGRAGAELRVVRPRSDRLRADDVAVNGTVRVLAVQHASNVTGHIHPLADMAARVKRLNPGCLVVADGSQVAGHMPLDVPALGVDAYVFSGHKGPLGPQGTGGFWARRDVLERVEPLLLGGGTVADVQEHHHTLRAEAHRRLEGGTPDVAGIVALAEGARLLGALGLAKVKAHEAALVWRLREGLTVLGATLVGPSEVGVVSFVVPGWGSHDVALALDKERIEVRSGHHCAQPLTRFLGLDAVGGTVRASFHAYNTEEDVDRLLAAVRGLAA
jgi:cysteine desulfurase / selenocysteine lyase